MDLICKFNKGPFGNAKPVFDFSIFRKIETVSRGFSRFLAVLEGSEKAVVKGYELGRVCLHKGKITPRRT